MRIGIDARLFGNKDTGLGRYTKNLIINLGKIDKQNTYYVFGGAEAAKVTEKLRNFNFIPLRTKIYSYSEQVINPIIFIKYKLDLLHVPHLNAPILYPKRTVITIHDLIKHFSTGTNTTTLPWYQYLLKHLVYKLVVWVNIRKSITVITPSNYWKEYLQNHYHLLPNKVFVTYEGVDRDLVRDQVTTKGFANLTKPYLVYTGNAYPHKNLRFLIDAIREFNKQHEHQLELAVICARDVFLEKIPDEEFIRKLGYLADHEVIRVYSNALALVQPSTIEGFGLTGLEAMATGLPVLSSNATCLPEIYQDCSLYFDPHDQKSLIKQIETIMTNPEIRAKLIEKGLNHVKKFSWYKMAKETLAIYKTSMR